LRHAGLSFALFWRRQATILPWLGIWLLQSRNTSGVQADSASAECSALAVDIAKQNAVATATDAIFLNMRRAPFAVQNFATYLLLT
jgi:hypothetical protein